MNRMMGFLIAGSCLALIVAAGAFFYFTRSVPLVVTFPCLGLILFPNKQSFALYAAAVVLTLGAFMRIVTGDTFDLVMATAALVAVRWLAVFIHENFRVTWGFRRGNAA